LDPLVAVRTFFIWWHRQRRLCVLPVLPFYNCRLFDTTGVPANRRGHLRPRTFRGSIGGSAIPHDTTSGGFHVDHAAEDVRSSARSVQAQLPVALGSGTAG